MDMKPDTVVRLGAFAFERYEVPSQIPFGGEQRVADQVLIGGRRIVDAMGAVGAEMRWSGLFQGERALERARALDAMRRAGLPLTLSWDELRFTVIITRLEATYQRKYLIPYEIVCLVIEEAEAVAPDIDRELQVQMLDDIKAVSIGAIEVAEPSRLRSLSAEARARIDQIVQGAALARERIAAVADLARAPVETVNQVRNAVSAVRASIVAATDQISSDVGSLLTIDRSFGEAADCLEQISRLTQLGARADRMGRNLDAFGGAGAEIQLAGSDLYRVASEAYGDPAEWTTIAGANPHLGHEPTVDGMATVLVPARAGARGGVPAGAE